MGVRERKRRRIIEGKRLAKAQIYIYILIAMHPRVVRPLLALLSSFGLVLSLYALHVETLPPTASALCDVTIPVFEVEASCSKTLARDEGRLLSFIGMVDKGGAMDLPNALVGVLFYCLSECVL